MGARAALRVEADQESWAQKGLQVQVRKQG